MRKPLRNVGASVRGRLLNVSKERNEPYELLLTQYALERLLYRLSISKYKEQFALKGAMLLRYWLHDRHRPTRDLDLLGFGKSGPQLTLGSPKNIVKLKLSMA
ncbi:nucleotidyl transferase AbiEii/AbiGii toxin family protein [Bradyrhizobium diazoefficiens]|nr:nucleotidyl transferase AbiEii/AbiGii toxin family protein [Bradyrhizobium diazoefficiens]QQO23794.1 nucleotidyl transferase AbiEii/AbiGii toxin family protein [Bradyrhizobium diazoefficiens]